VGELAINPWKRHGKDHLYVMDGTRRVARYDRLTGRIDILDKTRRDEVLAVLAPYVRGLTALGPASPPPVPESDVSRNRAGDALLGKAKETGAGSWAIGAQGEQIVSSRLRALTAEGWYVLDSIRLSSGADIDHVVISPAGVFTINTKHHRNARIKVGTHVVWVNETKQPYIRNSQHEARTAERLLSRACRIDIRVTPVLVFVAPAELRLSKPPPDDLLVATSDNITARLRVLPWRLSPGDCDLILSVARRHEVWLS
jgi:hypothetical protein